MTLYLVLLSSLPIWPILIQLLIIGYQILEHSCEYHGHRK